MTVPDLTEIAAISFDGDATLWDFEKVMRFSLTQSLAELRRLLPGRATDELTIEQMVDIREQVALELKGRTLDLEEVRQRAFERTVAHVGGPSEALASQLHEVYRQHRFSAMELYDDTIPALDALSSRCQLGLLSNGNSHPDRCGLAGRFDFIVFAHEAGVEKPDPRIFAVAAERAGCARAQLLHVGDSLATDVAGARGAGVVAVWLNRDGSKNPGTAEPHIEIRSLAVLPGMLGAAG